MRKKSFFVWTLALCIALAGWCTPVQAAQVAEPAPERDVKLPFSTVQARCAGHTEYLDKFGVTRRAIIEELSAHEHDDYYLGTPQVGGDWQSPRGDTSYNGAVGMNCAGFVGYVLRKCGLDGDAATATIRQSPRAVDWGSGKRYEYLSGASNYMSLIEYGNLIAYPFETKWALLESGLAEKGDLVMRFWTDDFSPPSGADNHMMIFWGDTPYEDKVWQNVVDGNLIGEMRNTPATAFVLIKMAPEPPKEFAGFTDVRAEDWYAAPVEYVKNNGYMQGTAPSLFEPAATVTRAQVVQVLYNLAGSPPPASPYIPFTDVQGHWATLAIGWAHGAGVTKGLVSSTFSPDQPITREETALLFMQYHAAVTGESTASDPSCLSPFADHTSISSWAEPPMAWAVTTSLLSGKDGSLLDPQGTCTRAQLAQIILNYLT